MANASAFAATASNVNSRQGHGWRATHAAPTTARRVAAVCLTPCIAIHYTRRMTNAKLIEFGGLPGTDKSMLAGHLADRIGAVWLRIDEIEGTLQRTTRLVA